jgi:hypothetical protein
MIGARSRAETRQAVFVFRAFLLFIGGSLLYIVFQNQLEANDETSQFDIGGG